MAPWEEEMGGQLGFDVWRQVLEKGGDGRGGGAAKRVGEWGGCTKNGGLGGRAARVMGVSGPKQDLWPNTPTRWLPTPMQAPNQRNSTALLVNVFPQIPTSQNATTEREKKTKRIPSNFSSLQTGCHTLPPLKRIQPRIPTLLSEQQKKD
jgi:hypothetical protein